MSNRSIKPQLFIIGAMKAGTSYLHRLLGAHPEIFMSTPKEPSFFVEPGELRQIFPRMWEHGYWQHQDRYLDLFADAQDAKVIGESSTNYTKVPRVTGVAARLHEFAPDARLIYVMRDPVARTISHYWYEVQLGHETRSIFDAIRGDDHYRSVSHYARQLAPYRELFRKEQILTLTFERLVEHPEDTVRDVFTWLGVDPHFVPPDIRRAAHVTPPTVQQRFGVLQRIRASAAYGVIQRAVPPSLKKIGRSLSERSVDRTKVPVDGVIDFLRPPQRKETEELSALLGRDFSEWELLYGEG